MIALLSPAKSLDYKSPLLHRKSSQPRFKADTMKLVEKLKRMSADDLGTLMSISEKLATLNAERYSSFESDFTKENSRQAILAFTGDVYQGLELEKWSAADFGRAQKQLRILSGLYGVLRPLDLIQPYRLEMGTLFKTERGNNLYQFWGNKITELLNKDLKTNGSDHIINLASNEYFTAVEPRELNGTLITPIFKDEKNGNYKIISFFAKKARGMMADYIVQNSITDPKKLKKFKTAGYQYSAQESDESIYVFLRQEQ